MTTFEVLTELMISKSFAVRANTDSDLPVYVPHRIPEDLENNHTLTIKQYGRYVDKLQIVTEEQDTALIRQDYQFFYRNTGDFDAVLQAFIDLLDRLRRELPYNALDKSYAILAAYIKTSPALFLVDRHSRLVYLSNVRLVFSHNLTV